MPSDTQSYSATQDILKTILPVLLAILAAILTYRNYLRQRENELVQKRYLDGGLDLLIGTVGETLSVFRHNWCLALSLLKQFRDVGMGFDEKLLTGFLPVDQTGMNIAAAARLRRLVNDNIGWEEIQEAFSFVGRANSFFDHDLAVAIRALSKGERQLSVPKQEAVQKYSEKIEALEQKSHRHYEFLSNLLDLAAVLEKQEFTFKSISQFHLRKDVRVIVEAMRTSRAREGTAEQKDGKECS